MFLKYFFLFSFGVVHGLNLEDYHAFKGQDWAELIDCSVCDELKFKLSIL